MAPEQPVCAADPGTWCARFYQWTNNDFLAQSADTIMSKTFAITLIVVVALLARYLIHRAITRLIEGATSGAVSRLVRSRIQQRRRPGAAPMVSQRRSQRARTIGSVLRSITSAVVLLIATVMILAEFGVALGPILASAGIVGVAIGFGAQNLVRDFLSGMFMLLEDQYGVGDIVDLGDASGTVEAVGLRITTVRDLQGTVWYVRNGEILRVGNMSQGYAVAVVDVPLAHTADTGEASEIAAKAAGERLERDDLSDDVLEPPEVLGVDRVTNEGVILRLTVRVSPGRQWAVQRALNAAITDAFDDAGMPRPLIFPRPVDGASPTAAGKG
ncbi:mechanosensitive ion channel family protein [Pseudonocardia bannensis]|uniref:Mechanosensitive ion channel family protein n=1 Tax=Pseudonocardia bannensis TaxID=630973 RepID=A0A848DGZ6_9PSEU|nr:mechanosensitive ion channel family protein [Pseudonocardia bannensis]NMH91794.1 mechanosensitive ion channel family protein [Pseudonocardia bannensis]